MVSSKFSPFTIMIIAKLLYNSWLAMFTAITCEGYGTMVCELNQEKNKPDLTQKVWCGVGMTGEKGIYLNAQSTLWQTLFYTPNKFTQSSHHERHYHYPPFISDGVERWNNWVTVTQAMSGRTRIQIWSPCSSWTALVVLCEKLMYYCPFFILWVPFHLHSSYAGC